MADFSFGFTEGSFLLLNGQKHFRSVEDNVISNKQKGTNRIYQKRQRQGHYETLKPISLNNSHTDGIIILLNFIFTSLHGYKITH